MISLRLLLILMGSVSLLMTIAVVMVKVHNPGYVTVAEVRAIDRICQRHADDMMSRIAEHAQTGDQTFLHRLHECMGACREYLIESRVKSVSVHKLKASEIPACFGDKMTRLAEEARQ